MIKPTSSNMILLSTYILHYFKENVNGIGENYTNYYKKNTVMTTIFLFLYGFYSHSSTSFIQSVAHASEGIRQSALGESVTEPIFTPSGMQERLNC